MLDTTSTEKDENTLKNHKIAYYDSKKIHFFSPRLRDKH